MPKKTTEPNNSIAPLIDEAHRLIGDAVRHYKLKVPANNIIVTIQTAGRKSALGWFSASRWHLPRKSDPNPSGLHEINLTAESLHSHDCGETLIHELAHAENNHLNVMDCSPTQYHNRKFKSMAERLGLIVKPPCKRFGFGSTELGPEASAFLKRIKFQSDLFRFARLGSRIPVKTGSRLLKVQCPSCGYVCRITRYWIDEGCPTCPCGDQMAEVKSS